MANGIAEDPSRLYPKVWTRQNSIPAARNSYANHQDDIYRVLVVSKFEERKGFPELLDGYAKAFGNDPTAKLLLKSDSLYHDAHPKMPMKTIWPSCSARRSRPASITQYI